MESVWAVILAAGEGTRMKSDMPKVLHKVCGRPMIMHVIDSIQQAGINDYVLVVGHKGEEVKKSTNNKGLYVNQEQQLGTGHAVMQAVPHLLGKKGYVLITYGDVPLISSGTLRQLIDYCFDNKLDAAVLTSNLDNPMGYGRIIRDDNNNISSIVEQRDANQLQQRIKEINTGIYCIKIEVLVKALEQLDNCNAQKEYYLTDVIYNMYNMGLSIGGYTTSNIEEIKGVNDRVQLAEVEKFMREQILKYHMLNGVTIIDPQNTYIEKTVRIGQDTMIYPGNLIEGDTTIGHSCILRNNNRICNSQIGDNVQISNSKVFESKIESKSNIGPFAYICPD